jgi:hypothetical protein
VSPLSNEKFVLGRCVATPGALGALEHNQIAPILYLARHVSGDWGDLGERDKALNDEALIPNPETGECDRILSMYVLPDSQKLYVITEWDRSVTTILLRDEY